MAHQHLGLAEIQSLAGLGELFDTLVVFENYPVDRGSLSADAGGLRLTNVRGHDATHYPLSLMAAPGERLGLRLDYRPDLFERASVEALAGAAGAAAGGGGCQPGPGDRQPRHSGARRAPHHPAGRGTTPRVRSRPPPCRSCSPPRLPAPPMRWRWCSRTRASAMASSMRAPISWRIICARSASAPRPWSGCASSARPRCSSGSSASSRPAAPICRSIPAYPHERLAFMLEDAGAPVLVTQSALLDRLPAQWRPHRAARCRLRRRSPRSPSPHPPWRSTRTTPPTSSTPQAPPERQRASRSRMAA